MFIGNVGFIGVDDPVDPANLHSKFIAQISSDQMDWIYSTPPHSSLLANLNLAFIIHYSMFVIHLSFRFIFIAQISFDHMDWIYFPPNFIVLCFLSNFIKQKMLLHIFSGILKVLEPLYSRPVIELFVCFQSLPASNRIQTFCASPNSKSMVKHCFFFQLTFYIFLYKK